LPRLPFAEDVLFSALVGVGLAIAFHVPVGAAWACMVCAMAGHSLRSALLQIDLSLAMSSLTAAFAAAFLARALASRFKVPPVTFAFPGVVTLMPGSYAFAAALGGVEIMHAGRDASPALIGQTFGFMVTTFLVVASIAIGLSLGLASPFRGTGLPFPK
jgi:uncharacterized membrane protein YjjB (DUF3815 family)